MIKTKNCPICERELFSEAGKGCKMCGMLLEDGKKDFCSDECNIKYLKIHSKYNKMRKIKLLIPVFITLISLVSANTGEGVLWGAGVE